MNAAAATAAGPATGGGLPVALRLAWWLLRGGRRRLALLLGCLALAVAGRVAVQTVVAGIEAQTAREVRGLLGGDLEIAAAGSLSPAQAALIAATLPPGTVTSAGARLVTMVRSAEQTRPVDLRLVDGSWPLVGPVVVADSVDGPVDGAGSARLLGELSSWKASAAGSSSAPSDRVQLGDPREPGESPVSGPRAAPIPAIAQEELFRQLDLPVGAVVQLGRIEVRLIGVLRDEPGLAVSAFSVGPRILLPLAALPATGLGEAGSRITWTTLANLPDPTATTATIRALRLALGQDPERDAPPGAMGPPRDGVAIRSASNAQAQASRIVERFADYLRLVALVALLLGGVGVGALMRGHLLDRLGDLALLRVLGATPARLVQVVLAQALVLGAAGGLLGALLGTGGALLLPRLLTELFNGEVHFGLDAGAFLGGPLIGAGVAVAATLVPLSAVIRQSALAQLRGEPPTQASPWRWPLLALVLTGLALLAAADARSLPLGLAFTAVVLGAAALLAGAARLALPVVARLRWTLQRLLPGQPLAAALGHGLANLDRPGNRPIAAAVAIGLGAVLLGALLTWRASLSAALDPDRNELPGLFLIDLQADQVAELRALCAQAGAAEPLVAPIVTARLRATPGSVTASPAVGGREEESRRFFRDREQRLSWRSALDPSERLTAGTWMAVPGDPARPEASLEERFAERLGVGLGDQLTFDVLGTPLEVTVTSLRRVDWSSFKPNFLVLVSPAALDGAPDTWIAAVAALPDGPRRQLQRELAQRFPNVTAFDVAAISQRVLALMDRLAWIIRLLALLALAAGLVILVGLALATAAERRQEGALLRILGARRRHLMLAVAGEFAVLGLLAGGLGALLAALAGNLIVSRLVRLDPAIPWGELAGLGLGIAAGTAVVGLLACRSAWTSPPLGVLRQE